MKYLLTSSGITNPSINDALVELLGKPIDESSALFVPTGMYPFLGGGQHVRNALCGLSKNPLCELGWKSLGVLELTALPSVKRESWVPTLLESDALLVYGGNVLYLCHWLRESGLVELFPTLENLVYVGVSAGSIAMTPHNCDVESNLHFVPSWSEMGRDGEKALGFVNFALWVHLDNPDPIFEDHTESNIKEWATTVPVSTYAIDDQTAIKVVGDDVEVVSEGHWKLFTTS